MPKLIIGLWQGWDPGDDSVYFGVEELEGPGSGFAGHVFFCDDREDFGEQTNPTSTAANVAAAKFRSTVRRCLPEPFAKAAAVRPVSIA